jgi:hypothetical protein
MRDKNNTLGAMGEALREVHLKLQTSQIENIPQRSSNATIQQIGESLKTGSGVEKTAESLEPSYQPSQQEPQQTKPPTQPEFEPPKRKHSKHKTHKRWQSDRVVIVLKRLFPGHIPTEAELPDTDLYGKVWAEWKRELLTHPPSKKTIRRSAGRLKDRLKD